MTELAHRSAIDGWVALLGPVAELSRAIAGTDFVPERFKNPGATAAAILTGHEVGLGPMTSLRQINVIRGDPALSAFAMRALVLANGHSIKYPEMTATRCVAEGRRKGDDFWQRVEWTIDDARQMGLVARNPNYRSQPRAMLAARATSELCRLIFADVIAGLPYAAEELDDNGSFWDGVRDAPQPDTAQAPRKRVSRALTPTSDPITPTLPQQPASVPPSDAADVLRPDDAATMAGMPPLPGEQDRHSRADDHENVGGDVGGSPGSVGPAAPTPDVTEHASGAPSVAGVETGEALTDPQRTRLHATFRDLGIPDRTQRLRVASSIVGRTLDTSNDLTKREAGELIDTLATLAATDDGRAAIQRLAEGRNDG